MAQSRETMASRPLELGCMEPREVLTTDGRVIGHLIGGWIDSSTWSVTDLVMELDKRAVDDLGTKKHVLRTPRVRISTSYVANVSDVIQLNADINSLGGALTEVGRKEKP